MTPPGVLPRLLVFTDRSMLRHGGIDEAVRAAPAVVVREKDLPRSVRAGLTAHLRTVVDTVLVASDPSIAADGVHLAAGDPWPAPRPRIVGRSCHSRAELDDAAAQGCDYATLSPIFATASKPGYGPPLGTAVLRDSPLPVFALGGVDPSNAGACLDAGAAGVAVMGAVMRAHDPAAVIAGLLR